MLREILNFALYGLPAWVAALCALLPLLRERRKYKRADGKRKK